MNKMQIRYLNYMYNKCRAAFLVWHIVVIIVVIVTVRVRVSWNGPG